LKRFSVIEPQRDNYAIAAMTYCGHPCLIARISFFSCGDVVATIAMDSVVRVPPDGAVRWPWRMYGEPSATPKRPIAGMISAPASKAD
jgi:hypothetical protein